MRHSTVNWNTVVSNICLTAMICTMIVSCADCAKESTKASYQKGNTNKSSLSN